MDQTAELYQLATECQALGSNLAKRFCTLCGLEATHCAAAQSTVHETVLSGCQACSAAYGLATATQSVPEREFTLCGLCEAANKAWKDTNDILFSHLLQYNVELASFISSTKDALRNKREDIWWCIHNLLGATNCSPLTCLSMSLQILQWLPSILWDLSFHTGVPSMFAYSPEVYKLHPWGGTGDGRFNH